MRIDFLSRLTGSVAITVGLVWIFLPNASRLAVVPIISGALFYFVGIFGSSPRLRETRGYPLVLIALAGITLITGLIGLIGAGFSTTDVVGQTLVTCLLGWLCRSTLPVLRSQRS